MNDFILIEKHKLTSDVYELVFQWKNIIEHTPGQFITFILPDGIWWRSYSILAANDDTFTLIIKRVSDGKKGSVFLCDIPVNSIVKWVWPVWKFVLHEWKNAKLFAGTGTGIVPLYNQIKATLSWGNWANIYLLFWVRTVNDVFYETQLQDLAKKYSNFRYDIVLSREDEEWYKRWYITDFVGDDVVEEFDEAYLCGAPVVVDAMQKVLTQKGFQEDVIYTEKY